jgi:hypothetical protein
MNIVRCVPILLLFIGTGLLYPPSNWASCQTIAAFENHPVRIARKNVLYHSVPIAVHIFQLQGELLPTKNGAMVAFDAGPAHSC